MPQITFYKHEPIPMEMHKVKIVQQLTLLPTAQRVEKMREAGFNTFQLHNGDIFLDMLTDSGVNAMSDLMQSAMLRADDAFIASVDIAANKAFTAVSLKMSTEELGRLAQPGGPLYGIQHTNHGRIVIFGGGVPLIRDGRIVGGFGVSGGTTAQDTAFGQYAKEYFEKELG